MTGYHTPTAPALLSLDDLQANVRHDPETGEFFRIQGRGTKYGPTKMTVHEIQGYGAIWVKNNRIKAHKAAWALYYGEWPQKQIDHINRDPLDNRIANLRLTDGWENQRNRGVSKLSKSGLKGVYQHRREQKWRAEITIRGVKYRLGFFSSKEEAAAAYDQAARALPLPGDEA